MFQAVPGSFSVRRMVTMLLALLKPYFQGTTRRSGAPFCLGSSFPYIPKASKASGCMASSRRRPSV
ncbi:hypothetical protein D3C71_2008890 [compost metagenome]